MKEAKTMTESIIKFLEKIEKKGKLQFRENNLIEYLLKNGFAKQEIDRKLRDLVLKITFMTSELPIFGIDIEDVKNRISKIIEYEKKLDEEQKLKEVIKEREEIIKIKITIDKANGIVILCPPKLNDYVSIDGLSDELKRYINVLGYKKIIIDLSLIKWIKKDAILGPISGYINYLQKKNGCLKIANLQEEVWKRFKEFKIISLFDIYDSVNEAVASFQK